MRRLFACLALLFLLAGCAARSGDQAAPPVTAGTVSVNGVDLAYRIQGKGEPLLMIMGYGGTMDAWDPALVDSLARSYRVILFDNRNVGYSGTSPDPVTIDVMARDALGLLKGLSMDRVHVLGWSMGSIIAQELALMDQDAVGKLVLYGTTCSADAIGAAVKRFDGVTLEQFKTMIFPEPWAREHPDAFDRLPVPAHPATPEAIARQRQAILDWTGTCGRLSALDRAVLVVAGEMDDVTPPMLGQEVAEDIPGAWMVRFKGGGHWLMYQAPEDLAEAVKTFLSTDQRVLH